MSIETKNKEQSSNDYYTLLNNDFKICDMCGNRIDAKVFVVKDENFNIIDDVIQCEDCYKIELILSNDNF